MKGVRRSFGRLVTTGIGSKGSMPNCNGGELYDARTGETL
jgi:hypothetical protein